jgi:hypothetical protein
LTKTTHADGTISTRILGWGSELNRKYFVLEQGTATPWIETWYDSKGRKVYTRSIGFDDCVISESRQYNTMGKPTSIRKRNRAFIRFMSVISFCMKVYCNGLLR